MGGMFKIRNAVEGGILATVVTVPVIHLPLTVTARIIIFCVTALPAAMVAFIGIGGESLTAFFMNAVRFVKNRRIIYRKDIKQQALKQKPRGQLKSGHEEEGKAQIRLAPAPADHHVHQKVGEGEHPRHPQQHPRQSDALYEHVGGLIPPAEHVKPVGPPASGDGEHVAPTGVLHAEVLLQIGHPKQRLNDVPLRRPHRLAAQPKAAPVEGPHGPQQEGQGHDGGLARTHRAVANEGGLAGVGPAEHFNLLGRQHWRPPSSSW